MECSECGGRSFKPNPCPKCPVVNINNPCDLVLFRKVIIPASLGGENMVPPVIGKYKNVLLHYEATGSNYLYSSDGIPTELTAAVPYEVLERLSSLETEVDSLSQEMPSAFTQPEWNALWTQ